MGDRADEDKLDSWKEIAGFLGCNVRTAQRWEKLEGMPVHRRTHQIRDSVWAYQSELLKWSGERKDLTAIPEAPLAPSPSEESAASEYPARRPIYTSLGGLGLASGVIALFAIVVWGVRVPTPSPRPSRLGPLLARGTQEGGRFERITVGKTPLRVAITPDGSELYVTNYGDGTVSVIERKTRKVTHTVPVGNQPGPLAISPDGRKVYVGGRVSGLSIIDTKSKAVSTMSTAGPVNSRVITPDGRRLFMAMAYAGLKRLWIATGQMESLPVVGCPFELAIDPPGRRLYVSYRCGGPGGRAGWDAIDVMDLEREVSVGTINGLPLVGGAIAVTSDNSQVWVDGSDRCSADKYNHADCPTMSAGIVHVIRATDLKHLATLGLPFANSEPVSFPDGSRVILLASGLIEVRDAATFAVVESLENTISASGVAFSPDGHSAFIAQRSPDGILVLEPEPPDCEQLRFGVYHLWPADGTVNDVEGQNHGKTKGGLHFAPGRYGQALSLDGTGLVELSSDRGFLNWSEGLSRGDWTVAAWVKPFSTDKDTVVIGRSAQAGDTWVLGQAKSGHWQFQIGSIVLGSKTRAQINRWYHVAIVHSRSVLSLYVNGIRESDIPLGPLARSQGISASIGGDPHGGKFFRGLIDEVRIHQAALPEPTLRSMARGDRAVCQEPASLPTH